MQARAAEAEQPLPSPPTRARHRKRSHDESRGSEANGELLLVNDRNKYKSMKTRVLSSIWMIGGFAGIIYMGHLYIAAMIVIIQVFMAREIFALSNAKHRERVPGYRFPNWYFVLTAMVYAYGRFLKKQLVNTISTDKVLTHIFSGFIKYHMLISYALYTIGFMWFILTLKKGMYQYQFKQFVWSHMTLFVVFAQSSFTVANIFEGIIWFLLPASLIVINDIAAYLFGFFFGRTPLIKLSPKKTWEGFIGASVVTMISAFWLSYFMGRSQWLTCPRKDLSQGWLQCEPDVVFRRYQLPGWHSYVPGLKMPLQLHALVFGLFASSIAPFGGFFASGFKRAFKIKDFGDSIPGHGGITDRMDCQMVMAFFSYIYHQTFIATPSHSVDSLLTQILTHLSRKEQFELYTRLGNLLSD